MWSSLNADVLRVFECAFNDEEEGDVEGRGVNEG